MSIKAKMAICMVMILVCVFAAGITIGRAELYGNIGEVFHSNGFHTYIDDLEGNFWEIDDDRFLPGQVVLMTMDDMNTEEIEDDEIVNIRVVGLKHLNNSLLVPAEN